MIGNQDNYLFLKQTLVVLQACRSGAEMDVNGVQINLPIAVNSALERIDIIEEEFTVPRFQEFVDATTVNYDHLNEMIILMGSTIEPDSELESLVKETGLPENLYKTVCDLPTCRLLIDEHYTYIEDGTRFPVTSESLLEIAKTVDKAFTWLREWVTAETAPQPLAQVILVINCIQLADEMIQFGNDRFIGC